jgi:hypothetical protein
MLSDANIATTFLLTPSPINDSSSPWTTPRKSCHHKNISICFAFIFMMPKIMLPCKVNLHFNLYIRNIISIPHMIGRAVLSENMFLA